MNDHQKYVDVVLPLPVQGTFTYAVPAAIENELRIGMRVIVPFGHHKLYTGIITHTHTLKPELYQTREIISILDDAPVLRRPQYKFWEWISSYYMASIGEVYKAAVPAGMKLESETEVVLNPDFKAQIVLPDKEQRLLDLLSEGKPVRIAVLQKWSGDTNILPLLKKLMERDAIEVNESVTFKVKPKTVTMLHLAPELNSEDALRVLFDQLSRAPQQLHILMRFIELSRCLQPGFLPLFPKKELLNLSKSSSATLSAMVEKGIFYITQQEIGRLESNSVATNPVFPLNTAQKEAMKSILQQWIEKSVVLLHGITSSGKTEIYMHLISKVLDEGKQVLYLVPEIALTTQLTTRLQKVFGNRLGVYHSRFSDAERVEIWNNVLNDTSYDVIIGVRSSVFLPFRQLGLIIVDEEHENSFKQYDPSPRYNARDAAIVLASMHGAKTLLGTATPSIESYFNASSGKYGLVGLFERHESMQLPEIKVVDMKEAYHQKKYNGHFSDVLLEHIANTLKKQEQVILFQNRRGYAPFVECKACAYVPKCKHCDVSLTLHAAFKSLNCHYCGYTDTLPSVCPVCKTPALNTRGFGTEKIEDEIKTLFPDARVARMDMDTTRSKKAFNKIITDVENAKVDILVGTQMVTKGLDFERVSLVGILNADNMLNFPDFRAHERAFQLMAQVAGRAGRKHNRGIVIVQTASPGHPVIHQVVNNDYLDMYKKQSEERMQFHYPPFFRMVQLTLRHRDAALVQRASQRLSADLRSVFGNRILGPVTPSISRIQNLYIRHIVLKIEVNASLIRAKDLIREVTSNLLSESEFKSLRISHDVDPG